MIKPEKETILAEANAAARSTPLTRWQRIPGAVAYSGLSRSLIYELLSAGKIKSHRIRGVRIIDRESIDSFISSHPSN